MNANRIKKNGGYSLVEVMVAMVISLIVLAGVYKTITDETISVERDEAVLDMQNNARAAITRVTRDLRRTGFFGCGGRLSVNTAGFAYPPTSITFTNNDADTTNTIDDGTDAITLGFLGGDVPVFMDEDPLAVPPTSSSPIAVYRQAFDLNEVLMVSDCEEYAIFKKTGSGTITATDTTTLPPTVYQMPTLVHGQNLMRAYGTPFPARVYNFVSSIYRVDGANLRLNGQAIAANIEDLQFEFIVDDNQDGVLDEGWVQTFLPADVEKVRVVRVWVLAMSEPAYTYTDDNTYDYPNSPYYSVANPFGSTNAAGGGSPASHGSLAKDRKHRYRYLASAIVYLRNAAIS